MSTFGPDESSLESDGASSRRIRAGAHFGKRQIGTSRGEPAPRSWWWTSRDRPGWEALAVFALALLLAVLWFHHAWADPTVHQVGIPGDADEYDWFLTWVPWAIVHGHNPLLSSFVNSSQGVNLMWNTSVVLPALLMAPVTALLGAPFSYNVLITAAPLLGTGLAYLAFRRWCDRLPSLAGALMFGFCPYLSSQAPGHLAQVLMMSLPLLLILGDRLLVVQQGRAWLDGLLLGLVAVGQSLTGEELLAMEAVTALFAVIFLAAINARSVKEKLPYAAKGCAVAGITFLALASPFLYTQFKGPYQKQGVHPGNLYVTDALNFVVPTILTRLAPHWALAISDHFVAGEDGSYLGIPLLALALAAVFLARRRKVMWVALVLTVCAGALSLGPTLHYYGHNTHIWMPDQGLRKLPLMKNVLAARFASVTDFGAALLVSIALTAVARMNRAVLASAWLVALAALAFIFPYDNYPAFEAPPYGAFTSGWVCPPPADDPGHYPDRPPVALVVPGDDELALLWQAEAKFCYAMPTARGMTGSNPVTREIPRVLAVGAGGALPVAVTAHVRAQFAEALKAYRVKEIIVAPVSPASPQRDVGTQQQLVAWLQVVLGAQPQVYKDASPTYAWKVLPPYEQIARGRFSSTEKETPW